MNRMKKYRTREKKSVLKHTTCKQQATTGIHVLHCNTNLSTKTKDDRYTERNNATRQTWRSVHPSVTKDLTEQSNAERLADLPHQDPSRKTCQGSSIILTVTEISLEGEGRANHFLFIAWLQTDFTERDATNRATNSVSRSDKTLVKSIPLVRLLGRWSTTYTASYMYMCEHWMR